ncbi:hypothetical protein VDG1235_671 [Verrucomicrobiia bacterium DG1235]|nr:hypothetical protein VDG1235_671 [Verrucomicrobiae bacterium DG1235]
MASFVVACESTKSKPHAPGVELSWKDNSDNEEGFYIWRSEEDDQNFVKLKKHAGKNETHYIDKIEYGVLYYYKVNAFNQFGESGFTNTVAYRKEKPSPQEPGEEKEAVSQAAESHDSQILAGLTLRELDVR